MDIKADRVPHHNAWVLESASGVTVEGQKIKHEEEEEEQEEDAD